MISTPSFGLSKVDTNSIDPWIGEWVGSLEIYNTKGLAQTLNMRVKHFKTDTAEVFGWYLIYGDDLEKGTRAYYLKTINEEEGHYQVDEKNSIFLDTYMIGNKMISTFDVDGSLISSIYTLMDDGDMMFEILYANTKNANESGDTTYEGEDIPLVLSYKAGGYQKAILKPIATKH